MGQLEAVTHHDAFLSLCMRKLQEYTRKSESNMAELQSPIHSAAASGSGLPRERMAFRQ